MKTFFYALIFLIALQFSAKAQWVSVNVPHYDANVEQDIEMVDANTIWAAQGYGATGYSADFLRSTDGGATWTLDSITEAGTTSQISSISPVDANTCYAAVYDNSLTNNGLYKTTDGGATWTKATGVFSTASFPDWVHFFDANNGVTLGDADAGGNVEVYYTTDGGTTWTRDPDTNFPTPDGTVYSLTNAYAVVGNTIWSEITSSSGNIYVYRSDDMGVHWTSSAALTLATPYFTGLAFTNTTDGMLVGGSATAAYAYATTDGGATWNAVTSSHHQGLAAVPGTSFFVSTDENGSSYSSDLGATWTTIDAVPHLADVTFLDANTGWTGENVNSGTSGGMAQWTGTVFPVSLISFTASNTGHSAMLNWKTANELNNNHFDVERSSDGTSFSKIGEVQSKGNSSQPQEYSYKDFKVTNGTNYYRLKQVDNDGKFTFSNITKVEFATSVSIKLHPNPVQSLLIIEGLNPLANTKLSIVDMSGKTLQQLNTIGSTYNYNVQALSSGTYYLKVETGGKTTTLKFVKE